jgi:hypothetical protein
MRLVEKHEVKRVVDMTLEFAIDGEGSIFLSNCSLLGLIRPEFCLMLAVHLESDMHLYTSP